MIRIFPTYMFLLFLFREASSSSPRSVPLICRENRDTVLCADPGAAAQTQGTGLQQRVHPWQSSQIMLAASSWFAWKKHSMAQASWLPGEHFHNQDPDASSGHSRRLRASPSPQSTPGLPSALGIASKSCHTAESSSRHKFHVDTRCHTVS